MAYTEVTRTSYGSRLKNSLGGIFIGILLFLGGTALLWWNEGRAVKTTKMLKDAEKNYVEMENISKVDPAFEGQLVHAMGLATTTDSLADPTFNVGAVAVKLNRQVEYYQWIEHAKSEKKDKIGGAQETTTTYTYSKDWRSSPVNSAEFKDPDYHGRNFVYNQFEELEKAAEKVSFGAYRLNSSQISSFHNSQPLNVTLDKEILTSIEKACSDVRKAKGLSDVVPAADSVKATAEEEQQLKYAHVSGNVLYIGRSPQMPEIGDVRITFTVDLPAKASILAKVMGDTFTSWKAKNGKMFQALYMGEKSAEEMFSSEHATNTIITWLLRILGVLVIIGGLRSIVSIVPTLLKVLPFLGQILESGLGVVCGIIGLAWSLIVIALAWLFYRPVLGVALLVIAGLLIYWLVSRSKKKKAAQAPQNQPVPQGPQPEIQMPQYQQPQQDPGQTPQQPQMTPDQQKEFEQWKQFQEFKKMQDQMKNQQNGQN